MLNEKFGFCFENYYQMEPNKNQHATRYLYYMITHAVADANADADAERPMLRFPIGLA